MEARESQRDLMQMAAIDELPVFEKPSTSAFSAVESTRTYLDLSVREKMQSHSTVTSLESLASTIDLRDEYAEKKLKRERNVITDVERESQVKEQPNNFKGVYPCGDTSKGSSKKTRKS